MKRSNTTARGVALSSTKDPKAPPAKRTLDELAASRTAPKLPAPPVFHRELIEVAPGRGRKAAADLEAAARANAEAAEEARRVALVQRRALEVVATASLETEKQLAALRREMLKERSENERLVTQARFRATQDERRRLGVSLDGDRRTTTAATAPTRPAAAPADVPQFTASPEMRTLQTQLSERDQLGESHRQRLLEALRERDAARLELQRVGDARSYVERRLERVTEVLHRATSAGGPHPVGGDGVEEQPVRALRDELAVAIARAKSAELRTNELRDEIEAVKSQRLSTSDTLEATRADLDAAREELSGLHARVVGFEAEQRTSGSTVEAVQTAEAHARDFEREVVEARSRAVGAEQRVAELTAALGTTTDRVEATASEVAELKLELSESRRLGDAAEARVAALQAQTERVEADLGLAAAGQADAEARLRETEGELVHIDGARSELDAYVDELRTGVARHEARVAELETLLEHAVSDHDRHSVDLEATQVATAAELTSASARAEHLAAEIEARELRIAQLEAALGATTAELGDTVGRADEADRQLACRAAEIEDLHSRLESERSERSSAAEVLAELQDAHGRTIGEGRDLEAQLVRMTDELAARDARLDELDAALVTAVDESSAAVARVEEVTDALGCAERAAVTAESALATARAERDVAVAQADSLTLELELLRADHETAEARITELEEALAAVGAEHGDVVARLGDLVRELGVTREERDGLLAREVELIRATESASTALADAEGRADVLEATRSDDRRLAEQAIEGLRTKADSAAAHVVASGEELAGLRARHTAQLERMGHELDAARARIDALDVELTQRREREDELRHALSSAEARAAASRAAEPIQSPGGGEAVVIPESAPASRSESPSESPEAEAPMVVRVGVPAGVGARDSDGSRPPSDLRRAVFASLTELAGDG